MNRTAEGAELVKRKSIHVDIPKDSHIRMRIELMKRDNLSMQSVFSEVAERIALGDPYMMDMLTELEESRRVKELSKVSDTDAESLFSILERGSPFASTQE